MCAYALAAHGKVKPTTYGYLTVNLLSSAGLIVNAIELHNWQNAALNVFWIGIALSAMRNTYRTKRAERAKILSSS